MTSELLDAQGQIPEVENLFEEATVKTVIKKANPQSAAGSSGLLYSHLQAALCDELVEDLATFATLVFSRRVLPQEYFEHCTSALNFLRRGKRRDQWRAVMSCGELLALFSPADTAGGWQTTSRPGASTEQWFQAE